MALTKVSGSILKDPLNLGEVSIGGTLTYEDVTNVDSVGLITARSGIDCNGDLDVAGVTTVTGGLLHIKDNTSPAIRLQDNNNVNSDFKIYSPDGDNHLRIYHQNTSSDLLSLTSAGKVGIGVTIPYYDLQVNFNNSVTTLSGGSGGAWGGGGIRIENTNTTTNAMSLAHFRVGDADWHIGNKRIGVNNSDFVFLEEGSEKLRIKKTGLVGIGITNPGTHLHVNSGAYNGVASFESTDQYAHILIKDNSTHDNGTYFGVDGNNFRFLTHNGSSSLERLRIHSNGLVTAQYQYHLHAQRSNDQTGYNASSSSAFGTPMIYNQIVSETKDSSLSSCFNTSTGVFTAPVLGLYHFCAAAYSSGNSVFSQSWFTLNGSRAAGTDWHLTSSSHNFVNNNQIIRLAAGNTVGFKPYASGQTNLTISANANHTYFKVTLIG